MGYEAAQARLEQETGLTSCSSDVWLWWPRNPGSSMTNSKVSVLIRAIRKASPRQLLKSGICEDK